MLVSCKPFVVLLADEFNRVIIPVKRGEENTDYVNASFIDVSGGLCPMSICGTSSASLTCLLEKNIYESINSS